jgi:hypothetical protein
MNWTDNRDGAPPLPPGWCDAWQQLHPADPGYTYDARSNPMLPYKSTPPLRLDRCGVYWTQSSCQINAVISLTVKIMQ